MIKASTKQSIYDEIALPKQKHYFGGITHKFSNSNNCFIST